MMRFPQGRDGARELNPIPRARSARRRQIRGEPTAQSRDIREIGGFKPGEIGSTGKRHVPSLKLGTLVRKAHRFYVPACSGLMRRMSATSGRGRPAPMITTRFTESSPLRRVVSYFGPRLRFPARSLPLCGTGN